ncbi:MAG TPA: hypothetical protein VMV44_05835 [Rectinemataceae bacterium]|nr:hypothetical protein [Rectinemataceae bacterium]
MKKLVIVLAFASLVAGGAFAQLMFGATGDLHMDTTMSASDISNSFQTGENIFYGPFAEIAFGKLGLGVAGTFSFYTDNFTMTQWMDYDVNGYLSYHLFRARAFLDPFVHIGFGYMATDYANSSDKDAYVVLNPYTSSSSDPISASLYWNAALGLGVNLGPLGVFGQLSYNFPIAKHLTGTDSSGNSYDIPYYGYYDPNAYGGLGGIVEYVPKYRFTLGAKLIL